MAWEEWVDLKPRCIRLLCVYMFPPVIQSKEPTAINNCCLFSSHIVPASDFFSDCLLSLSSSLKQFSIIILLTNLAFLNFSFQQFTISSPSLFYPNTFSDATVSFSHSSHSFFPFYSSLLRACSSSAYFYLIILSIQLFIQPPQNK